MTAMFCSRHQTGWDGDDAVLCPVCADSAKPAHHDFTEQETRDRKEYSPDTPRCNYARSCGTGAFTVEACKLERELAAVNAEKCDTITWVMWKQRAEKAEAELASCESRLHEVAVGCVEAEQELAAVRELMNVYNLGGWTDAVAPMKRALEARTYAGQLQARLTWAANELLACDYGDNDRDVIGWRVYGWRSPSGTQRIYGATIDAAIDAALAKNPDLKPATALEVAQCVTGQLGEPYAGQNFRKRPVVIQAVQWNRLGDHPAVRAAHYASPDDTNPTVGEIDTLEGTLTVQRGDWIITGVKGEVYACKPDIFALTYEPESTALTMDVPATNPGRPKP